MPERKEKYFSEEKRACKSKEYLLDFFGKGAGHPSAGEENLFAGGIHFKYFKNPNPEKCFLKGGTITWQKKYSKSV